MCLGLILTSVSIYHLTEIKSRPVLHRGLFIYRMQERTNPCDKWNPCKYNHKATAHISLAVLEGLVLVYARSVW